jgi:hypothetical protein
MRCSVLVLVVLALATATAGCAENNDCSGKKCHPVTHILDACLMSNTCTINGAPMDCGGYPGCLPFNLPPGAVLRIPLDWSAIGAFSTGLTIRGAETADSFTQSTVLFDDAPTQDCTFTLDNVIQCTVPPSVQSVSFSYSAGLADNLDVTMTDSVCFAEYPACEL